MYIQRIRHTDEQKNKQTYTKTKIHKDKQKDKCTDIQTDKHADIHTDRQSKHARI